MQAATEQRKRKIEETRVEDRQHRLRIEARKLDLKVATEARLRAAEEAKLGVAGAKEKQLDAKKAEVEPREKKGGGKSKGVGDTQG